MTSVVLTDAEFPARDGERGRLAAAGPFVQWAQIDGAWKLGLVGA